MAGMDQLVWWLAIYAPLIVVWLVGIFVCFATWRKHPQVSLLVCVGLVTQLLQTGTGILFTFWINRQYASLGWSSQEAGTVLNISALVQMSVCAIGWALVLLAVFLWRSRPNRILGHDGQYLPENFVGARIEPVQPGDHHGSRRPIP
jgi:hypothetical protein